MYFVKTILKPDLTFPIYFWTFKPPKMQAPPELTGVRVPPPVSMQEQIVIQKQQQNCIQTTASSAMTIVVSSNSAMMSIPMSLSLAAISGTDSRPHQASIFTNSKHGQELLIVDSQTGTIVHQESHPGSAQSGNDSVYRLSEVVLKEKDALFQPEEGSSSVYVLEPPRETVQTVRMRNKNFFTVLEESDEEADGKTTPLKNQEKPKQLTSNYTMYTPVFSFGQSLHHIFHQTGKHNRRNNKAVAKVDIPVENQPMKEQQIPTHTGQSGYESDREHSSNWHWYSKMQMSSGLRRNRSQPNLEKTSIEEFIEEGNESSTTSQSLPCTPGGSPKLKRRNSFTNLSMESLKPELRKPEASGPGLSFLASVAGELRTYKKKHSQNHVSDTQVVEHKPDSLAVEKQRPMSAELPKRPNSSTSVESSPGTNSKLSSAVAEMKALHNVGHQNNQKKSFFKSVIDWSTTTQNIEHKESNMYSPSSF